MKKTGRSDADGAVSSVAGCIRETVRRHRLMSLLLAAAIAGSVVLSLLPPLVLERIIDSLAEGKPIAFSAAAGYFLITAVSGLLDAGKETMITVFGQKATHQIRSAMSSKLRRLPSVYFIEKDPGVTVSRFVNDVNTIDSLFASGVISMAADVCRLAGILLVIFTRSTGLGLLLLASGTGNSSGGRHAAAVPDDPGFSETNAAGADGRTGCGRAHQPADS